MQRKKVAKLIMDDIDFAANASITELAEGAQVSEATITRFAKAIGCNNVRDMKIKLGSDANRWPALYPRTC